MKEIQKLLPLISEAPLYVFQQCQIIFVAWVQHELDNCVGEIQYILETQIGGGGKDTYFNLLFLAIFLHHQFFSCFTDNENSIPVPLLPRASSNFLPSFTQTQNKHRTKTKKTCIIARKKLYRLFISFKVTNQLKSVQKHKHKASFVLFMVEYY